MNKTKILLIDDNKVILDSLKDIFTLKGYIVYCATNGKDTIDIACKISPDVALIDILLPDIDGIDLLKKLKFSYPDLIAIILTGNASVQNAIQALKFGANGYFVKPVSPGEIFHRIEDVREKQRLQIELIRSEEKYKALFENSSDAVILVDSETFRLLDVNNQAEKLTNYTKNLLLNMDMRDILPDSSMKIFLEAINILNVNGFTSISEVSILKKGGVNIEVEANSRMIEFQGKKIIQTILRDVTLNKSKELLLKKAKIDLEQKIEERTKELLIVNQSLKQEINEKLLMENALRDSEERFRTLSNASNEGVIIHENGNILDINTSLAGMVGCEIHDLIGKNFLEIIALESRGKVNDLLMLEQAPVCEAFALRCNGITFPVEIRGKTIPYLGRLMQVVTIRDISFIKELEKERLLRVQLKAIMETMITLNHKINNDLQNIMGKSEILMDKLKNSSTDIYDSLNTINNSAENIASVILKLSKVVRPISTFYTNETSMLDLEASIDSK